LGNKLGRQNKIDTAGVDGTARHTGVLRRGFILGEGDAAGNLNGRTSFGAIGGCAGKNYSDSSSAKLLGHRLKKVIDGHVLTAGKRPRYQAQRSAFQRHIGIGRNYVDAIPLHRHGIGHFNDRNPRGAREDFPQHATVRGIEVLHQGKRHPRALRQVVKQFGECLQPSRGGSDSNDGE
jgi:hypothetical protein